MKPDEATLHSLYIEQGKSLAEIGRLYEVHKNQVRRWLLRAAIPTRSVSEGTKLSGSGGVKSPEHLEKLRNNAAKARAKITPESRAKQSETRKRLGLGGHNKGIPWSPEHRAVHMSVRRTPEYRANLSASLSGEKNPLWRGGRVSRSPSGWKWREVRNAVYERDNWTCQECGCKCLNTRDSKNHTKRKIQCHHIVSRRNGGGDEMDNLVTLCMSCHHKIERKEAHTKE